MMRILAVSNYYPPHFEGGYEISLQENLDALAEKGHEIFVLCGHKGQTPPAWYEVDFLQTPVQRALYYLNYHHPQGLKAHQVQRLNYLSCRNAIRSLQPDLLYFGNQKGISTGAVLAAQDARIPRIFDVGDDWLKLYLPVTLREKLSHTFRKIFSPALSHKIDFSPLICPSLWLKEELQRKYHSQRIYRLPRGIRLPQPNPRPINAPLRSVFAGRIEPLKGIDLILEAARTMVPKVPDFHLDIYGEGAANYLKALQNKIQAYKLEKHFSFKGQKPEIKQLLQDYDLLLMPSLARESFGRIIIEAMAAKCIVIASDAFGPAEIITHNVDSFLFPPTDSDALAALICEIYHSPQQRLELIRENAYQSVASKYNLNLLNKDLELILTKELDLQKTKKRQR